MQAPQLFDTGPAIELLKMPYHVASAFKALCAAAEATTPHDKLILMASAQEHVDNELVRLRLLLQKATATEQPERLFGAVLDPDCGLAEEALNDAYLRRDLLKVKNEGGNQ